MADQAPTEDAGLPLRGRRAEIAQAAQTLREVRDALERANDPYDPELGSVHARLAIIVNDLRDLARPAMVGRQMPPETTGERHLPAGVIFP